MKALSLVSVQHDLNISAIQDSNGIDETSGQNNHQINTVREVSIADDLRE